MIDSFCLEAGADHHDRDRVLETAADFLGDVTVGSGEVPTAFIAFGTDITVYTPTDASAGLHDFVAAAAAAREGRQDEYALAIVYPHEPGARIWTAHERDGQGTVDHGIHIPETRYFKHVPPSELH